MNADLAVFTNASARIVMETIWIRGTISGLLKMVLPIRSDRVKVIKDSVVPKIISNAVAAASMLFMLASWFSLLYFAVYLMMDWSSPRSRNIWSRVGVIRTMAYSPYSDGVSSRAIMIIPKDEIIEEIAIPQNRLNPPLAEILAKLNDLSMRI